MADMLGVYVLAGGQVLGVGRLSIIRQSSSKQQWFYVCE